MRKIYLPALMYHGLAQGKPKDRYWVSVDAFEEQIRYLHENSFTTVLHEDISSLGRARPERFIMITFDDGYETDYTLAFPILNKYEFKAVLFITTANIGKEGYMNWEQVSQLKQNDFSIQSHTHTHPFLNCIQKEDVRKELMVSKKLIEENLNTKVIALALPGGRFHKDIKNIAYEEGYRYIFSSCPGATLIKYLPILTLCRMLISQKTSLRGFKKIVNINKGFYKRELLSFRAKELVRKALGQDKYYQLWKKHVKSGDAT